MSSICDHAEINGRKSAKYKLHVCLIFVYILITPLSMIEIPGIGSAMKIMGILLLSAGLILIFSENVIIHFNNRFMLAWTAYVFYTSISIFWSTNFKASLDIAVGLIQVLVISLILAKFTLDEEDIKVIEAAWLLVSLICLLLFFGGAGQQIEYGGRISIVLSTGGADPNEFCAYFYMTLAIITVRLFNSRPGWMTLTYVIYMLAIFCCILLTGSRGGLLAAIAVVAVSWMFSAALSLKKIVMLGVLIAVIYLAFLHIFASYLPQSILERLHLSAMIEDKGSERILIWTSAIQNISSGTIRLLFGYGPFGVTFMKYTMHNQFIQALMDGGIIGLALYLNLFRELIRKAYQNGPAFLGGIAGVFTALMTLSAYAFFKPVWIIFLMCLLTVKRQTVHGNESEAEIEYSLERNIIQSNGI